MASMSFKALLDKAIEPLRAFAERIDAQIEKKHPAPALATGSAPFKRATTSSLTLASTSDPAPTARFDKSNPSKPKPSTSRTKITSTSTSTSQASGPTVQVEGPGGEFFRLAATTPVTAQLSIQTPEGAPAVSRMAAIVEVSSSGDVAVRDAQGRPYLSGKTVGIERDGRVVTLTVSYRTARQAGSGTLFVGFTEGRLTFLSGSGTARDEAGRTVVCDLRSVAARSGARSATPSAGRSRVRVN